MSYTYTQLTLPGRFFLFFFHSLPSPVEIIRSRWPSIVYIILILGLRLLRISFPQLTRPGRNSPIYRKENTFYLSHKEHILFIEKRTHSIYLVKNTFYLSKREHILYISLRTHSIYRKENTFYLSHKEHILFFRKENTLSHRDLPGRNSQKSVP
jgi:hypothetical protein